MACTLPLFLRGWYLSLDQRSAVILRARCRIAFPLNSDQCTPPLESSSSSRVTTASVHRSVTSGMAVRVPGLSLRVGIRLHYCEIRTRSSSFSLIKNPPVSWSMSEGVRGEDEVKGDKERQRDSYRERENNDDALLC